jgi:hypothetical protein
MAQLGMLTRALGHHVWITDRIDMKSSKNCIHPRGCIAERAWEMAIYSRTKIQFHDPNDSDSIGHTAGGRSSDTPYMM